MVDSAGVYRYIDALRVAADRSHIVQLVTLPITLISWPVGLLLGAIGVY